MSVEKNLKRLILSRYRSTREFTVDAGIPYTTLDSIFRRGINNSSVDNVIKICKTLWISADELAEGRIVSIADQIVASGEQPHDIELIIDIAKSSLIHGDNLTLKGKPVSSDVVQTLITGLEVSFELAKKHNKNHNKNEVYNKTDLLDDE